MAAGGEFLVRWFIVLLIVANVILFFWVQQQSRPLPGSMSLPPPDVGRLRLLSELNEEPAGIGVEAPAPVEPLSDPVWQEPVIPPVVSDAMLPEVELALDSGPVPSLTERLEAALAASGPAPLQTAAAADVSVEMMGKSDVQDQKEPPVAVEQEIGARVTETESVDPQPAAIVASDELQPQAASEPEGQEDGREEQAPGPVVGDVASALCYRVGPFDPEGADKLISELPVSVALLSDLSEEYSSVDRYYVLIPPLPSRAVGRQKLQELAEAGVTDTWLFPSGEYRNAISLGFFSREGGAKRHAANMVKKGFPAEVRERTTTRETPLAFPQGRRWRHPRVESVTPGRDYRRAKGLPLIGRVSKCFVCGRRFLLESAPHFARGGLFRPA